MHKQWLIPAVAAFVMVYGINAEADDSLNTGWAFEFTPYLWAAGIDGDVTVRGRTANVDMDFNDLVDDVDIGGSFLGVVRKNRFVMWAQFDYVGLESDDLGDVPSDAKLETNMLLLEAAGGYQFHGPFKGSTIDAMVGFRYGSFENKLTIQGAKAKRTQELVDPMLVVRPRIPLYHDWIVFSPTLAVGGGGDSEFIYELQPQLQFQFTENLAARVGYRRLHYKFEGKRDNEFDADLQGFIVGLGVKF